MTLDTALHTYSDTQDCFWSFVGNPFLNSVLSLVFPVMDPHRPHSAVTSAVMATLFVWYTYAVSFSGAWGSDYRLFFFFKKKSQALHSHQK